MDEDLERALQFLKQNNTILLEYWQCLICKEKFDCKANLFFHLQRVHPNNE